MIVDGKKIAEEIKIELAQKIEVKSRKLRLDVVWVGDDPVSERYVNRKKKIGEEIGVEVIVHELMLDISEEDLIIEIEKLNDNKEVSGIIVQLPLPSQIDEQKILNLVLPDKDVDGLNSDSRVLSPTVGAIKEILERNNVSFAGKKVAVVGKGKLVGRPVAIWLTQEGADVSIIDSKTVDSGNILKTADIIISGVGKPGLITPDKIKQGAIIIDTATSEQNGSLKGDADPACAEKCLLFTPVPGGVGPITVVMIFKNLLELN